jgi:hypothetical protein
MMVVSGEREMSAAFFYFVLSPKPTVVWIVGWVSVGGVRVLVILVSCLVFSWCLLDFGEGGFPSPILVFATYHFVIEIQG